MSIIAGTCDLERSPGAKSDHACFSVPSDDSSGIVTEKRAECTDRETGEQAAAEREVPRTSDDALRLAIKLAIDAGEYERAAVVLGELRRTTKHFRDATRTT